MHTFRRPTNDSGPGTAPAITYIAIILDRSGSMESCRDATISGYNEYVESVRKASREDGLETAITLTVFNHHVEIQQFGAPLSALRPIDRRTYVPGGNTAMLDAVGQTLDRLVLEVRKPAEKSFLVCVISDGYENASRHYTYEDIAERIQRLTAEGNWTFTYLGSNQDLSQVSERLHIPAGNVAAYAATPGGTGDAWTRHGEATRRRAREAARGVPAATDFYRGDESTPDGR